MLKRILIITIPLIFIAIIVLTYTVINLNKKVETPSEAANAPVVFARKNISFSETGTISNKGDSVNLVGKLISTSEKLGSTYGVFEISTNPKIQQEFLLLLPSQNKLLVENYKIDNINAIKDDSQKLVYLSNSKEATTYLNKYKGTNFLLKIMPPYPDANSELLNYLNCNKTLNQQLAAGKIASLTCTPFVWTISKYEDNN